MRTATNHPFTEAAYRIGARLCRNAIWAGNKCNWVGPSMEYIDNTWKTVYRAYATDVYSGTSGIGYFLSHLYAVSKDPIIKKTALGCFEQATANATQAAENTRIGFYTGWAGMAHVLQQCGPLLNTDAFEQQAGVFLQALHQCSLPESGIDILAGCAGAIPVLLAQRHRQDEYIITAKKIGDYLIQIAHKAEKGWSWNTLQHGTADAASHLAGFSHGTAGIAWAFIELHHATKEDSYLYAARQAFAYERYLYNAQYGNWPDLRSINNTGSDQNPAALYGTIAWCHGAPGIGLSRLRAYDLLADATCKQEAETAVSTTSNMLKLALESGQGNFSLCHGIAGNTELLLMAAASFNNPGLLAYAQQIGQAGINLYAGNDTPWPCGVMGAGETPGLMLGLAGIGYFYLRLSGAVPGPSILIPFPEKAWAFTTPPKTV